MSQSCVGSVKHADNKNYHDYCENNALGEFKTLRTQTIYLKIVNIYAS